MWKLIDEVPGNAESNDHLVHRIVRHEERVSTSLRGIDVRSHQIEAGALQVEVRIDIHHGIVSNLLRMIQILHGILPNDGRIGRRVVGGEENEVGTEFRFQNFRDSELHIEI